MKKRVITIVSFVFFNLLMVSAFAKANVIYVNQTNQSGTVNGETWATAYTDLQEGIDQASKQKKEVWVAKGTYYSTTTDDKTISFQMKKSVSIYGGFAGTETKRQQRDWTKNLTILNGGRKSSDVHSYHVVTAASDATLDGFVITGGRAVLAKEYKTSSKDKGLLASGGQHANFANLLKGPKNQTGGGLLIVGTNPTIRNCMFVGNSAQKGGAVYQIPSADTSLASAAPNEKPSTPIKGNPLTLGQQIALFEKRMPKENVPVFDHVIFINNTAFSRGGAINNDMLVSLRINNSIFYENMTTGKGGAIYNDIATNTLIVNTLFVKNEANLGGGAVGLDGSSMALIVNSTFTRNISGDTGAGLYLGSHGINRPGNFAIVINSIFWNNLLQTNGPTDIYAWAGNEIQVQYSDIEQDIIGQQNIKKDPLFISSNVLNFNLSQRSPCLTGGNSMMTHRYVEGRTSKQLGYLNDANLSKWIQLAKKVQQQ